MRLELAEGGRALHQPAELGVLGDVALHEQGADLRVEAGGHEQGDDLPGLGPEPAGSWGTVRAWRSTTQYMESNSCWSCTQRWTAPR